MELLNSRGVVVFRRPFCVTEHGLEVSVRHFLHGILRVLLEQVVLELVEFHPTDKISLVPDHVKGPEKALGSGFPILVDF